MLDIAREAVDRVEGFGDHALAVRQLPVDGLSVAACLVRGLLDLLNAPGHRLHGPFHLAGGLLLAGNLFTGLLAALVQFAGLLLQLSYRIDETADGFPQSSGELVETLSDLGDLVPAGGIQGLGQVTLAVGDVLQLVGQ